jgi:hypothetical protein
MTSIISTRHLLECNHAMVNVCCNVSFSVASLRFRWTSPTITDLMLGIFEMQ